MKKILICVAVAWAVVLPGCKTTEANYRAAYEKTMAAREADDAVTDLDSTIYGKVRRNMDSRTLTTPAGREVEVRRQFVRVTEGGGGIRENLKPFSVVAGRFKQVFNARSLRNRLAAAGYPGAFVVETAEPYYYIVAASFPTEAEATAALDELAKKAPVAMKAPVPFILQTAR